MKIGRKRKAKAEIPTSSMSDIAFLLIVFFMATTKFDVKEGIRIVLPQAATEGSEQTQSLTLTEQEMTRLQITEDGQLAINKDAPRAFESGELDALIQQKLKLNQQMIFKVITDREAKYNDMIRVVDRLKAANIEKISLSTN
ncbi:MAG: biopolymer transporter ExbD [Candidatus Cloacimonetes bacterium]|jgi:biopolymer transport protein ExbD|nr:biopolymer transporter ExbD [Candidatus Cloacimonadota bacterium]MDD2423719.1 biopolymer transporter ExbD [Candidatus Cloacimonadota bacterium]MDD3563127.1 biopolymer transporter ExbD [Candidatus Cloacimonadota bacterium]MDD4276576.1 biopolymer transporter ExbD [Candidatus Cloacimonadota bacterium]MDY0325956.1 biopolymer transporter ExbD [Candidatus Cloacimonadaceae bacterium]